MMIDPQVMLTRYRCAAAFEMESAKKSMILNGHLFPHWIGDSEFFWYVRYGHSESGVSTSFRLVNAATGDNDNAFDHDALALALSVVSGNSVNPAHLPFYSIELDIGFEYIDFMAYGKNWRYNTDSDLCYQQPDSEPEHWLVSPDGSMAAFVRDYNLYVRVLQSGEERALTTDGTQYHAYAIRPEREAQTKIYSGMGVLGSRPEALWSPDSSRLLTTRLDERQVGVLPITKYVPEDGSVRPICRFTKYSLPGDEHVAKHRLIALDVLTGKETSADYPKILDSVVFLPLITGNRAWWGSDSKTAYFIDVSRGQRDVKVISFDTNTGQTQVLFEESAQSYIDLALEFERPAYLRYLPETHELIWFSERTGWAHLYLYDLRTGSLKHSLTQGAWLVREILHVDAERRELFALAAGRDTTRDPYYREVIRVDLDTGNIVDILSGDFDCTVWPSNDSGGSKYRGVASTGNYLVCTQGRIDQASESWLLSRDGERLSLLETADLSGMPIDWRWPEPVVLKAADGKTDIYGAVFRPSYFDPEQSYPILDWAGTNPFYARVPKVFNSLAYYPTSAMALAELGFVVVMIDGRGSCYRSKAFHDHAYGMVHKGSDLEDHVSGIRQLAKRYSSMDINRVGIVDVQGSNAPAYGVLAYPDFYQVGAMASMWDPRLLTQGEIYQGPDADFGLSAMGNYVRNLKGKLFIVQGIMDPFFHVSGLMQFLDATTKENKDVDIMLVPNGGHSIQPIGDISYTLRRIWDYLVIHLLKETPPLCFKLKSGVALESDNIS